MMPMPLNGCRTYLVAEVMGVVVVDEEEEEEVMVEEEEEKKWEEEMVVAVVALQITGCFKLVQK